MAPPPCRFFQVGTCTAGTSCRFSHEKSADTLSVRVPCKFFAAGYCANGERCPFQHERSQQKRETAPPRPPSSSSVPPQSVYKATLACAATGTTQSSSSRADDELCRRVAGLDVAGPTAAAHAPQVTPPPPQPAAAFVPTEEELQISAEQQCAVCLDTVLPRGRFGILIGCDHCVCIECTRQWRATHAIRPQVARSCPECRALSHFVVPSSVFVTQPARKGKLVRAYTSKLGSMPCKHFAFGTGTCPFGTSCFYAHTDKAGRRIATVPRRVVGDGGSSRVLPIYTLSDHLFPQATEQEATNELLASIPLGDPSGFAPAPALPGIMDHELARPSTLPHDQSNTP